MPARQRLVPIAERDRSSVTTRAISAVLLAETASRPEGVGRRADQYFLSRWLVSRECAIISGVLYGPSHEAVPRYARQHVAQPGRVLGSAAALACWPQGWEPPSPGAGSKRACPPG